jgi:hypothetical protein
VGAQILAVVAIYFVVAELGPRLALVFLAALGSMPVPERVPRTRRPGRAEDRTRRLSTSMGLFPRRG